MNVQIGRIVHVVHPKRADRCLPAIVVQNWGDKHGIPSAINAVVFTDGSNDGFYDMHTHNLPERLFVDDEKYKINPSPWSGLNRAGVKDVQQVSQVVYWETSVGPNHAVKTPRSWHWPRRCDDIEIPQQYISADNQVWYHIHKTGMIDPHNCNACKVRQLDADKAEGLIDN